MSLSELRTDEDGGLEKEEAQAKTEKLKTKLEDLQELMYAAGTDAALIILQGRDTSGKDGTIRHLSTCLNVQNAKVASFKQPTAAELKHDFLWRVHAHTPGKGEIAIFNRSHYEDVLVVRVHDLVPKKEWKKRYEFINQFESLVADSNTVIFKFYLHISKDEQERRLLAREAETDKAWKLSPGDWKERELWDDYTEAYEAALSKCSTEDAPWYVIPADHKWYRDLCITEALVDALGTKKKVWKERLEKIGREEEEALRALRSKKGS